MTHSLIRGEFREKSHVIQIAFDDVEIRNPEVMERREHFVIEGILQRDAICNDMVKETVYVIAIGA